MKKKYALVLIALFCFVLSGYGQTTTIDFETANDGYTPSTTFGTGNADAFNRTNTPINGNNTYHWVAEDISGDPSITLDQIDITGSSSFTFAIDLSYPNDSAWDGTDEFVITYSIDGGAYQNLMAVQHINTDGFNNPAALDLDFDGNGDPGQELSTTAFTTFTTSAITLSGNTTLDIRFQFNVLTANNEGIFLDNIVIQEMVSCTDELNSVNVQFPTVSPQTITVGGNFDVYSQADDATYTPAAGANTNIEAWIGYNTVNNNPNTAGWTWIPATYNTQVGNNDEYVAEIGSGLASGTYYYASRYRLNGCGFTYGGTGGNWNNDSVQLIVEPDQVDFCNVDFPKTANITTGDPHNVFAQAYKPGVTDAAGQGGNLEAWIGYNTTGINYQPWQATGWTWVAATYDSDANGIQNDQYVAEIGSALPSGTYYYASRFRLNGSDFSYGGIQADNVGNFWDATNNNGTLVVTDPPLADVVITEIMYNPPAADDYEWVEICNLNGVAEDISNYSIDVNGTTRFTFPGSTSIPANTCITVLLGHLVSSPAPECPFIPDYANPIGNTNVLINGGATISLESPTNTVADVVVYDDADSNPTDGNGSSFHVIDATLDNSDTDTNWQAVLTGGSPGLNALISPCSNPEIQLVDDSNTNQACGYTIDFGLQAIGFNTDITFDIDNVGALDLDVTSLVISGADAADFSIVSPAVPFTVTPGNTQTVTVRFNTATIAIRNAILTINSNDTDESACDVNLTAEGVSPSPNIVVRGIIGANPTIPNGSNVAYGFNNTLYGAQDINDAPIQTKDFRIANEGGTDVLNVSSITLSGAGAPDFTVNATLNPIAIDSNLDFTITFDPVTDSGTRVALVTINNSDPNKDPYTFIVQGTATCPSVSGTIQPTSGPAGTTVTILSPGNDLTSILSAELNGVTLDIVSATTAELIVRLPNTITTGGPLSIQLANGCIFSNTFTLIDETISGCEASTGGTVSDLFISEVTDSPSGSLTYVELYNATGADINFAITNYDLTLYNNGNTTTPRTLLLNSGTVVNNSTFVISFGIATGTQCPVTGGDGSLAQADQSNPSASINFFRRISGFDDPNFGHDYIGLYSSAAVTAGNPEGIVDTFGTRGDESWAVGLGLGTKGANFQRDPSSIIPNSSTVFDASAWTITDWNDADCSDVDYSTIGDYDFSTGVPPSITLQPIDPMFACSFSVSLSVAGMEGFDEATDTQDLAYRWFVNAPGSASWNEILPANPNYTGQQTAILNILDISSLDKYQYYCQVREDDNTCYIASNAVILSVPRTIWDGSDWTNSIAPDEFTIAIIDGTYDTAVNGNIDACQLIINAGVGRTLNVSNSRYVRVVNDVVNNGIITVQTHGAFVQDGIGVAAGTFTNNGSASVIKETENLEDWYEYTYWSSPVIGQNFTSLTPDTPANRRFYFETANYLDQHTDGTTNGIPDDIDDDGNDWQNASGDTMELGRGYAATSSTMAMFPGNDQVTFVGDFVSGNITKSIIVNGFAGDNDWNFIGNPYASAIDFDDLHSANSTLIDGAAYLWSQALPPLDTNPGNENMNFNQADYAIITVGSGNTAGGSGVIPVAGNFIPSGQGFFVRGIANGDITFTNAMRRADTSSNDQFFRSTSDEGDTNVAEANRLWLNLTSDNGVFNQILVAYVNGATNGNDGWSYDAPRNLSSENASVIYTLMDGVATKFAIQGKAVNSLTINEIIPVGFKTSINQASIYKFSIAQLEGEFLTSNTIYLKDKISNVLHNLSEAEYAFTSETGEFNGRFEIVFRDDALSVTEHEITPSGLIIFELGNGTVKFSVANHLRIQNVEILDLLGRRLYNLRGDNSTEIYDLSNLSQATYIAKVSLSNGQTITKKAVKRH